MDPKLKALLVKTRGLAKANITRLHNFVKSFQPGSSINAIRARLDDLPKLRQKYEDAQERLELEDESEDHSEDRNTFETMYYDLVDKMTTLIEDSVELRSKQNNPSSTKSDGQSSSGKRELTLPTIKLPSFGGQVTEFRHFCDAFTSLVINNQAIDDIQRYHYLLSSLTGEAHGQIKNLPITGPNFKIAWQTVCLRYNNPRLIATAHINNLLNLPRVHNESPTELRALLNQVSSNLNALEALELEIPLHEILLAQLILEKTDDVSRKQWELTSSNSQFPRLEVLSKFLEDRCQALELINGNRIPTPVVNSTTQNITRKKLTNQVRQVYVSSNNNCLFCTGVHPLYKCQDFSSVSVAQRTEFAKQHKLCTNCLRHGHIVGDCSSGSCYSCGLKHHTLLHRNRGTGRSPTPRPPDNTHDRQQARPNNSIVTQQRADTASYCSLKIKPHTHILLSTALVKVRDGEGQLQTCRVLLDSGSQAHFITTACTQRLNLKKVRNRIPIQGISSIDAESHHSANIEVHSITSNYQVVINCAVLSRISAELPGSYINYQDWQIPEELTLADPSFNQPGQIDMLIGAEIFFDLLRPERRTRSGPYPVLQNTEFGWIVAGQFQMDKASGPGSPPVQSFFTMNDHSLDQQLQRFWELEEITQPIRSNDEIECERHFVDTVRRDAEGRFTVRLPLCGKPSELGNSLTMATSRFHNLERRLERNPQLKGDYVSFLEEYETLGHMEPITTASDKEEQSYFMPHHPVFKESSSTTKTRVVFDASASTTTGRSLNDILRVGPTIQQDIWSIITRFRTHQICFTADIRQMYRQIRIDSHDRRLQRIVWRSSPEDPVKHYQLNTVTYGTASAPFLATRCLQQLAMEESDSFPEAAKILQRDFYIDDCMSGSATVEDALDTQNQLINLLQTGGFQLRKWCSNHPRLLEAVPSEWRETQLPLQLDNGENIKTLGLLWHPASDQLQIVNGNLQLRNPVTKRKVLSTIASIYDPLGLVSPIIISCKFFLQQLWQLRLGWDEILPPELLHRWQKLCGELPLLNQIRIDRLVLARGTPLNIQLHGFSDASEKGYGCCIYLRSETQDGDCVTKLLSAKSRVAPLKRVSLPRLELCGALLLSRLIKKVNSILNLNVTSVHLWTDSTIVLAWIAASPNRWKTFIANRVAEIQQTTSIRDWKHVASADNPADMISRGVTPETLISNTMWWNGPSWLMKHSASWPTSAPLLISQDVPEQKKPVVSLIAAQPQDDFMKRFSKLTRLTRVTAYCIRFAANARHPRNQRKTGELEFEELRVALHACIKIAQASEYGPEINDLRMTRAISKGSKLLPLNPFLCDQKLLRVGGRLQQSDLPFNQKHQIILPPRHHLTKLIIENEHLRLLHAGCQLLLSSLREQYWIPNGKSTIRHIIHFCIICHKLKAKNAEQLMGQLPNYRVTPVNPFIHCGIDYAGPFYIKAGSRKTRSKIKCYVALFVCLSTRAVHLEIVSSMTTQAFIASLRRFISRRGRPAHVFSDNGRNFVGANRELEEIRRLFNEGQHQRDLSTFASSEGIQWHFIPPQAPHFGGIWEAGVKSFKHHLRRVMGTAYLTFEELSTLTTQIEGCLNSRPLVPASDDPDDLVVLTPSHFLIGRPITALPQPDLSNVRVSLLSRWQQIQRQFQGFWKAWSTDYLSHLQQRGKWKKEGRNVQAGTLVIVKEDKLPPLCWKLAVVDQVHPGADGLVRVATIRTSSGTFKRPITKLCPLPMPDNGICEGGVLTN